MQSPPASTSRIATRGGRFSGVHQWPVLGVHRGLPNDDKGIIARANGEEYLIEKGVGCLSFWRFEGKRVLVTYPGVFGGVGSRLVLPDVDQSCRIWSAEQLSTTTTITTGDADSSTDIAAALQLLGFSSQASLSAAIASFQRRARITANGVAGSETRVALSKALADSFPQNLAALQLALRLVRDPTRSACEESCAFSKRCHPVSLNSVTPEGLRI